MCISQYTILNHIHVIVNAAPVECVSDLYSFYYSTKADTSL